MALTNNLKVQVDIPVWEWCRLAPAVSSSVSSATAASNSMYHVNHGRYIYYLQAAATVAGGTGVGTGFWRYDTITDTYQQLAIPPIAPATYSSIQFIGGHGYYGRVLSSGLDSITCAAMTGQRLKDFDIRITGGTGLGQHRIIKSVSDPIIAENGTITTLPVTPELSVIDANKNWTINQWVGYQLRFVAATGNSVVRKILYNSSTTLYFSDSAKYAEDFNAYAPIVTITGAALTIGAVGTQYQIESSTMTMDAPWTVQPDETSRFLIHSGAIWLISSGTTYTLQYYDIASDVWYVRNSGNATSPVTAAGTDGTIVNTGEIALIDDRGVAKGTQTSNTIQDTTKSWTVNYYPDKNHTVRIFSGTGQGQTRKIISNTSDTLTVFPDWTTIPDSTSKYFIDELDSGNVTSASNSSQTGVSTGSISGNVFTAGATTGAYYRGQILSGTGVQSTTPIITASGACFTAGLSTSVVFSYGATTGITTGMTVSILSGTGVLVVGTQVASVNSTTVTLNIAPTTALANATLQFVTQYASGILTSSSNGNLITVGSTTNLFPGMIVSVVAGTGVFTVGTYVTQIVSPTTFYVNATPTTTLASATIVGQPYQTVIQNQTSGIPGGAGTYYIWPAQNVASTTITGTGVATITDLTKTWSMRRWNGQAVRIISGTGVGQVRSIINTTNGGTEAGDIIYTSSVGATSSGTTITVSSTAGLIEGLVLNVTSGTGAFDFGTTVVSVTNGTTFVASSAPATPLSGGATVITGSYGYLSLAGATSLGTIITVNSTNSLKVGMYVNISSGIGSFSFGTSVTAINSATTFTVSTAPTTPLSGGATIINAVSMNTLIVYPNWTVTPDSTSVYVVHGDPDKLYFSLATQTPTFIHNVDSDMVTLGRRLDDGVARGVCAQYGDYPAMAISSAVPVSTINYIFGTGVVYTSAASAASSGALVTVTTTAGLFTGCPVTVAGGAGTFAANTYVLAVNSATTFTVSATPSVALSGAAVVTGTISALVYHGMGPFTTTSLSGTGSTATATFSTLPGSTYTGTNIIPVGSLITIMGALPVGYNGTFVVTASSAGSVSWSSAITGAQTVAGTLSSGAQLPLSAAAVTVAGCVPIGYNAASITTTATAAGFIAYANATVGQLTSTTAVLQHLPQTTLGCSISGTTATVTTVVATNTYFPIGSRVSVVGTTTNALATVGSYNGVWQVTASSLGSCTFTIPSNTPTGSASIQGTIQLATQTQWVTTVNSHNFKAGQIISHMGDTHAGSTSTNISAAVYPIAVPGTLNQYLYSLGSNYAGTQIIFAQTASLLIDATKNWVPNQWANCLVTFNSTQGSGTGTNPTILSAYILANTPNKLIFAAAHSAVPAQGVSRYVITLPHTALNNSVMGASDSGLALGSQLITQIQDNTKYWAMPANVVQVAAGATTGQSTITVVSVAGIFAGMTVAVTTNTAGSLTLPPGTTVVSIAALVVTLSNSLSGGTGSTTFTFMATANSSGNTVTLAGYSTLGLQVGMYLGVTSIDNVKITNPTSGNAVAVPVAGAFVANGGIVLSNVYVTEVTDLTHFKVSSIPTTPLLNANVFASFWFASQWNGRRVKVMTGNTTNFLEATITGTSTNGILTFATIGTAPVSGVAGYAILQQPIRGLGTALFWNFGQTDYSRRGSYLYQARGGGVTGFDRLDLKNDIWEFLTPTPNYEVLTSGAMYAYDGEDRLYFTPQITQRVYYFDIEKMQIHGGSQYPYLAGTAINGNRMEIFTTVDGLKYLWLNRHSFQECFKELLFY